MDFAYFVICTVMNYSEWVEDLKHDIEIIDDCITRQHDILYSKDSTRIEKKKAKDSVQLYRIYKRHIWSLMSSIDNRIGGS